MSMNMVIRIHINFFLNLISAGPQVRTVMATTLLTQTQLAAIW